eukprot:scaffold17682_cov113-Isochrysis_galbana.AAC.3
MLGRAARRSVSTVDRLTGDVWDWLVGGLRGHTRWWCRAASACKFIPGLVGSGAGVDLSSVVRVTNGGAAFRGLLGRHPAAACRGGVTAANQLHPSAPVPVWRAS